MSIDDGPLIESNPGLFAKGNTHITTETDIDVSTARGVVTLRHSAVKPAAHDPTIVSKLDQEQARAIYEELGAAIEKIEDDESSVRT